jgi:hypothetical protein
MRLAGSKLLLFLAVAFLAAGSGCENPFDPLNTSDKIQGLTYFDFAATQEHWDSDPEWDGVQITMSYYNEFGDSLSFHDKKHKVQIEFWSQKTSDTTPPVTSRDKLLITKTVDFSNSDDLIRIPVEYYYSSLPAPVTTTTTASIGKTRAAATFTEPVTGYLLVRVFPPQEYPQKELVFLQGDVEFFTPEEAPLVIEPTTTN